MSSKKFNKRDNGRRPSEVRKSFYKRIFYIGICLIPIIIFADNKGAFRLLPLPFFLIGMYQLIKIIAVSQLIIDDFFPPKTLYEKTIKPFNKFIYYFSSTLFFVGLLSLMFEIRKFDNTINGGKLFWTAGVIGLGIAIILTIIIKSRFPSVYFESKRRFTVHFGLFGGLFLVTTALAGFINHYFADNIRTCKNYLIKRKVASGGRSTEYFIYLTMDENREERFSVGKKRYDNFEEGEEIRLCAIKGKFGFDYVKEFKKINE